MPPPIDEICELLLPNGSSDCEIPLLEVALLPLKLKPNGSTSNLFFISSQFSNGSSKKIYFIYNNKTKIIKKPLNKSEENESEAGKNFKNELLHSGF